MSAIERHVPSAADVITASRRDAVTPARTLQELIAGAPAGRDLVGPSLRSLVEDLAPRVFVRSAVMDTLAKDVSAVARQAITPSIRSMVEDLAPRVFAGSTVMDTLAKEIRGSSYLTVSPLMKPLADIGPIAPAPLQSLGSSWPALSAAARAAADYGTAVSTAASLAKAGGSIGVRSEWAGIGQLGRSSAAAAIRADMPSWAALTQPAGRSFITTWKSHQSPIGEELLAGSAFARIRDDVLGQLSARGAVLDEPLTALVPVQRAAPVLEPVTDLFADPRHGVGAGYQLEIARRLDQVKAGLGKRFLSAWECAMSLTVYPAGPAANEIVEVVDQAMRALAGDDAVLAWVQSGERGTGMTYEVRRDAKTAGSADGMIVPHDGGPAIPYKLVRKPTLAGRVAYVLRDASPALRSEAKTQALYVDLCLKEARAYCQPVKHEGRELEPFQIQAIVASVSGLLGRLLHAQQ